MADAIASRSSTAASRPVTTDMPSNRFTCLNNHPMNATRAMVTLSRRINCRRRSSTSISANVALAARYRSMEGVVTGAVIIASGSALTGGGGATSSTGSTGAAASSVEGSTRLRHGPSVISHTTISSARNRNCDSPSLIAFVGSNFGIPAGIQRVRTADSVTPKNAATSPGDRRMNRRRFSGESGI